MAVPASPHISAEGLIRKRQIVVQAARLFDARGYHQTSMADIADAVGLRKPSLYHYFQSKEVILLGIHEEFVEALRQKLADRGGPDGGSVTTQLRGVIGDIVSLMDSHRPHVRVFFEHFRELPAEYQREIADRRDDYFAMVEELIRQGVREGVLRDLDPRITALALFGLCNWTYQWYRSDGSLSAGAIADLFWDVFFSGVRAA